MRFLFDVHEQRVSCGKNPVPLLQFSLAEHLDIINEDSKIGRKAI